MESLCGDGITIELSANIHNRSGKPNDWLKLSTDYLTKANDKPLYSYLLTPIIKLGNQVEITGIYVTTISKPIIRINIQHHHAGTD
jgi:hypothetical protein